MSNDCYHAEPMHFTCVGCHARADGCSEAEHALVLLAMLRSGEQDVESIYRALCFEHRRLVDRAAKAIVEAG